VQANVECPRPNDLIDEAQPFRSELSTVGSGVPLRTAARRFFNLAAASPPQP
jgi:hypothetical protein